MQWACPFWQRSGSAARIKPRPAVISATKPACRAVADKPPRSAQKQMRGRIHHGGKPQRTTEIPSGIYGLGNFPATARRRKGRSGYDRVSTMSADTGKGLHRQGSSGPKSSFVRSGPRTGQFSQGSANPAGRGVKRPPPSMQGCARLCWNQCPARSKRTVRPGSQES